MPKRKNIIIYLITALLTIAVTAIIFNIKNIYPQGSLALPVADLRGQYTDFLQWFGNCLRGNDSLLYSLAVGMGGNSMSFAAYYLFSPINLLTLFIDDEMVLMTAIYCIKLILCAVFACTYFLNSRVICEKSKAYIFLIPLLSASYAYCGFCAVYGSNIIWIDTVYLFPLILLGAEKLYFEKKSALFSICLGLGIIFNFYIGLMAAVFAFIYLIFLALWDSKKLCIFSVLDITLAFSRGICIGAISLLPSVFDLASKKAASDNILTHAGGLNLAVLIPLFALTWLAAAIIILILSLVFSGKGTPKEHRSTVIPTVIAFLLCILSTIAIIFGKYSVKELLQALLPGKNQVEAPQLYLCSIWIIGALLLMTSIRRKNIKDFLCVLFLCLSSFVFLQSSALDLILHFGQEPISFPHRYTFAISFFMLIGTGYAINSVIRTKSLKTSLALCLLFTAVFTGELSYNGADSLSAMEGHWGVPFEKEVYDEYYSEVNSALNIIENGAYRTEKSFYRTSNEQMNFGYNGISHYSSLLNGDISRFSKAIGLAKTDRSLLDTGATPFIDSVLGIKYFADSQDLDFLDRTKCVSIRQKQYCRDLYESVGGTDKITVYENKNALGLAFMSNDELKNVVLEEGNPFINQNFLASSMTGINRDLFVFQDPAETDRLNEFTVTLNNSGLLFLKLDKQTEEFADIYVNGELVHSNTPDDLLGRQQSTVYAGYFNVDETADIRIDSLQDFGKYDFMCYVMDMDAYSQISQNLHEKEAKILEFEQDSIKIQSNNSGLMFTSIPCDKGWIAKINGQKTKPQSILGFMCFDLTDETSIIEVQFYPPGFTIGVVITLIALLTVAAAWILERKRNKKDG